MNDVSHCELNLDLAQWLKCCCCSRRAEVHRRIEDGGRHDCRPPQFLGWLDLPHRMVRQLLLAGLEAVEAAKEAGC